LVNKDHFMQAAFAAVSRVSSTFRLGLPAGPSGWAFLLPCFCCLIEICGHVWSEGLVPVCCCGVPLFWRGIIALGNYNPRLVKAVGRRAESILEVLADVGLEACDTEQVNPLSKISPNGLLNYNVALLKGKMFGSSKARE
jgi:hypothetical protein